jgi:hypothetical protein
MQELDPEVEAQNERTAGSSGGSSQLLEEEGESPKGAIQGQMGRDERVKYRSV